ncbi:MAG: DUF3500 domain-containing protein [Planctomycetaceae bacterium]|nr:DUF3500 domain-containing protein [Planctomycetaceae bacterium]
MRRPTMRRPVIASLLFVALAATSVWSYFKLARTGEEATTAAKAFLAALDEKQQKSATLEYGDPKRVAWHFIPLEGEGKEREGLQIRHMNEAQRKAAHALLKVVLSEAGYGKATKIMELESLLAELQKGKSGPLRDAERYYFAIFGQPTADGRWGLSIEGHHLSLNFVIEKGNVISSTPTALCANPANVMNENIPSITKGTRVLAKEETLAFDLLASLSADQRKVAIIADKALGEVRAAGEPQPPKDAPAGIAAEKLTGQQRSLLQSLIEEYANNLPVDVAKLRMEAIDREGLGQVHFAWAGADKPGIGHYYRIQGPTFLIELVNNQQDSAGNQANHIHSVWRDMTGDFALSIE